MVAVDPFSASCGPLDTSTSMVDDSSLGPSLASAWRRNLTLPVDGRTQFLQKGCSHQQIRGWPDRCSPMYDPGNPEHRVKCSSDCMVLSPTFQSGEWYFASEVPCPVPGYDLAAVAVDTVESQTMAALAYELATGALTGSPSLEGVGWDLTPEAGPVSVTQGLSILMAAYAKMRVPGFTIHVPWPVLPFMATKGLLAQRGGLIATAAGVTVDASPGYPGVAPSLDATGALKVTPPDRMAPDRGEVTVYATKSAVEYNVSPVGFYGGGPIFDHSTNSTLLEATRRAIIRFNTTCVFAVTVRLDDPGCAGD